jgi:hypothetical protein
VVRGESVEHLLDELAPAGSRPSAPATGAVQRMRIDEHGDSARRGAHDTAQADAFQAWIDQLERDRDVATLERIRGALHHRLRTLSRDEAVARSVVQRALDKLAGAPTPRADGDAPALEHLPRAHWWKLFIEGAQHQPAASDDDNAMVFDRDKSPGYYGAMSLAFEEHVAATDGHELDFADYNRRPAHARDPRRERGAPAGGGVVIVG